jgi:glycosyltransferase 2 family protein
MSDERRTPYLRRHAATIAVSLVVAIGFGWLMHRGALPVVPPARAFAKVEWWTVAVYVACWLATLVLRSARWYWLLAPIHRVPMRRVINVSFIGYGALILLPFRLGELVRPVLIRKRGQLSAVAATGTVGAERILDGLILSASLFVALPLSGMLDPLPDRIGDLPVSASVVPSATYSALTVFVLAFAAMGVFYWRRQWASRVTEKVLGVFSMKLARWMSSAVSRLATGFGFLPQLRYFVPYVSITAAYWWVNIASTELLMWGVGLGPVTFARACVVTGVLGIGSLLPNAPGFFGAFQLSLYAALALFYSSDSIVGEGAAFVFLLYVIQMGTAFLAAVGAAAWERVSPTEALDIERA